jgi:hypothetical protein
MKIYIAPLVLLLVCCRTKTAETISMANNAPPVASDKDATYRLQLIPSQGAKYYYDITNESETELEIDGKEIAMLNKTSAGIIYTITKDSAGDFLLDLQYDKIKIYSKSGETEKEMSAAHASTSLDPVEKMLGMLKNARISATINNKGEVKSMRGYKELGDQILAGFSNTDNLSKEIAHRQWQQLVEEGVIRKNMDQLFKIFPDSLVRVGETWTIDQQQKGEIELKVKTNYTLEAINREIARITSIGNIHSDSTDSFVMGFNVQADMTGKQKGEYEMESATGMMINNKVMANVEGTLKLMGRNIPVTIKTILITKGKRLTE